MVRVIVSSADTYDASSGIFGYQSNLKSLFRLRTPSLLLFIKNPIYNQTSYEKISALQIQSRQFKANSFKLSKMP